MLGLFVNLRPRRRIGQALRVCLGLAVLAVSVAGAAGQGLPPAPAPVPGGLLDSGRTARPAPAKPQQAEPKEDPKPAPAPKPQQAAPAAKQPSKAKDAPAAREQAKPKEGPKAGGKPTTAKSPPRPSPGPILPKLEPINLKVPAEYRHPKGAKRAPTEVMLSAVGPDLAPRFAKGGRCAAPKAKCPDFTNLIVFRTHDGVAAMMAKRYKSPPESLRTFAAAHGLSQIPPRAARGYNTRHFFSTVDGRPVWVVCHRYDAPKKPRPESRYCDLTFDAGEGVAARLIFHEARLQDWRKMHSVATSLVGRLRG